jgi:hypothetical protein
MDKGFFVGIIGVLISSLGVFVSLFVYRSKRPLYQFKVVSLDSIKHPMLGLTFGGENIPNIYSVRFVFWNGGRKEIRKEDIPDKGAGPFISIPEEFKVLLTEAETTTGDKSGKFIEFKKNNFAIIFDYLNHSDALYGQIYCTSEKKGELIPKINGSVKGFKIKKGTMYSNSKIDQILYLVISSIAIFVTCYALYSTLISILENNYLVAIKFGALLIFFALISYLSFFLNAMEIPNNLPKRYEQFFETGNLPDP